MFFIWRDLKPVSSILIEYFPTDKEANSNLPSSFVEVLLVPLVTAFVTVTLAPVILIAKADPVVARHLFPTDDKEWRRAGDPDLLNAWLKE